MYKTQWFGNFLSDDTPNIKVLIVKPGYFSATQVLKSLYWPGSFVQNNAMKRIKVPLYKAVNFMYKLVSVKTRCIWRLLRFHIELHTA